MSKSEGQVLDFEKICRLCLVQKRSMSSIFSKKKSDKKMPLAVRIMSCASLELYEGDGLPASICSKCLLSVNQSYAFREQCEQADTTLRQYAQRMHEASGETSSNRELGECSAKGSPEHIEDNGIKFEEGRVKRPKENDEDHERSNNWELNCEKVAISSGRSFVNLKENEGLRKGENEIDRPVKEGEGIGFAEKDNRSEPSKEMKCSKRSFVTRCEINGKIKKNMKECRILEIPHCSASFEKKAENMVIEDLHGTDVPKDEDSVETDIEDESLPSKTGPHKVFQYRTKKGMLSCRYPDKKKLMKENSSRKKGFENEKQMEILQSLMNNKNIVLQKKTSSECVSTPGKVSTFKSEDFVLKKVLHRQKSYLFSCDFKIAQLWKEWKEANKRIPKVEETKCDAAFGEAPPHELKDDENQNSGESVPKNGDNPRTKWKNAKDTVYCKDCSIFLMRSSYNNHIKFVHKKIRKYLCQTCGYAAYTGTILRQHVQAVHVGYSFFCDQCPKKFNLMKRLRKHMESQHSGKPVPRNHICQYCGMAFSKAGCLTRHLRSHTQETPYQCQYCQRRFKYRWPKVQHERLHTGEKPYKCSFCEERFTQNCVRKAHEYKKHGNEEFKPKKKHSRRDYANVNLKSKWKQPMEEDVSEKTLKDRDIDCKEMEYVSEKKQKALNKIESFDIIHTVSEIQLPKGDSVEKVALFRKLLNNKDITVEKKNLADSLIIDDEEKLLIIKKLSRCAKECLSEDEENETSIGSFSLTNLKVNSTEMALGKPSSSVVFCKECNLFMKRSSYAGHNRFVHRKVKKYLCQTCGYTAHTGSILRQHIQAVHVGYTFECDKCLRKFNLLKRLRKHKEVCDSEAPIAPQKKLLCHFCGLKFSRLSYLKIHFLTHTGEAPLQCQYCDRKFKFRWARIQHERLHTGIKPYKCEFCEKSFTQNRVRKMHECKVHGNSSLKDEAEGEEAQNPTD